MQSVFYHLVVLLKKKKKKHVNFSLSYLANVKMGGWMNSFSRQKLMCFSVLLDIPCSK